MKIKNEAELLNKFCDVFHAKPLLRTPFLNTEYNEVWSTDGRVFIGINPEILTKEYPKGEHPFPKLEFPCEKTITIEALNKAFNSCPMVDEEVVVEDVVEVRNAHFFANQLRLLKTAMEYLNADTVKMTHNDPKGANEFIISKDIRIIIMPMLFDYSFSCSAKLELVD